MLSSRACSTFLGKDNAFPKDEPKIFALGNWANPETDFYIPTAVHVEELHRATEPRDLVLVRGPPASGKTTLAHAIRKRYNYSSRRDRNQRSYIFLAGQSLLSECKDGVDMEEQIMVEFNAKQNLSGHLPNFDRLKDAIAWLIRENIAVIVDEAHMIFRTSEEFPSIYSAFLKHDDKLTGLFFTTTSESVQGDHIQRSPSELSKTFFFSGSFDSNE